MEPIPTAPRCSAENRPINAVSTELSKGTEILVKIFGIANRRISFDVFFDVISKAHESGQTTLLTSSYIELTSTA